MRPLLIKYAEPKEDTNSNEPEYEYSNDKNLNIDKRTKEPIFDKLSLGTNTQTKVTGESTDSDYEASGYLETQTLTLVNSEATDSDSDLHCFLWTMTNTRGNIETNDQD